MRKKSVGSSNDHSKTSRQTIYQRGSNQRDGSPHYVFLYSDDEGSGAEEDIPLERVRSAKTPPRKVEVIKVLLKAEDTLQALALRYRCTISELKRVNNIHKENEIFAHRYIKVPVQPFSIFTENLIDYEGAQGGQNPENLQTQPSTSKDEQLINLITTAVTPPAAHPTSEINDIILNSVCEPLTKYSDCQTTSVGQNAETEQLISTNDRDIDTSALSPTPMDSFSCSGADWGLSWTHLLGVSLLLGIAVPVYYILYVAEESPDEN